MCRTSHGRVCIKRLALTEVLEWRYKAIQRSGANDE
ncbi:TPA: GpE family phage tail protein [Escherichia coli]|nr:GpE family phage tail protein [Escherichia coli]HCJ8927017.1 GpE family phage tail protein [Escherichia coli]